MFDYVHLLKSIRNNWLTEKSQELFFADNGQQKIAKWQDLTTLYNLEKSLLVKLSKFNEQSVSPKPIERQKGHFAWMYFANKHQLPQTPILIWFMLMEQYPFWIKLSHFLKS